MKKVTCKGQLHTWLRNRRAVIFAAALLLVLALSAAAVAYFTYAADSDALLTVDGKIRLDAFGAMYEELRAQDGYGTTPDNPFVIDSAARWNNLLKLNNSGYLDEAREYDGQKYYFCLQFNETDVPQVLNLANDGTFEPVGTEEYPFVDELSGVTYQYNGDWYSGCIDTATVVSGRVSVNGEVWGTTVAQADGDYYLFYRTYTETDGQKSLATVTDGPLFVPASSVTVAHQMIANQTIALEATASFETSADNPIDVGVFGLIGESGDVHDLVLYNINVTCTEDMTPLYGVWRAIVSLFTGHETVSTGDRHIGIFAGHVDGNVANISVAGQSTITINTQNVNYYSAYTTVGYFGENATIGGLPVISIVQDTFTGNGNVGGCMFADAVYALDTTVSGETDDDTGVTYYELTAIQQNGTALVQEQQFSYGSFTFLLSDTDDTVSTIWDTDVVNAIENGDGTVTLSVLNDKTHGINTCVLYCNNEYRETAQGSDEGAAVSGNAAVSESRYTGIADPDNSGSVIDAGKYLIAAKVAGSGSDGYDYYALKIKAEVDAAGTVSYVFDTTQSNKVTSYVEDTSGNETVYMSALWQVTNAGSAVTLTNCRFTTQRFTAAANGADEFGIAQYKIGLSTNGGTKMSYDVGNGALYFTTAQDGVTYTYYLTYDAGSNAFGFSTTRDADTCIVLYQVSNGYTLQEITSADDLVADDQYLITAESGGTWYALSLGTDGSGAVTTTANAAWTFAAEPLSLKLDVYTAHRAGVWLLSQPATNNNATVTFNNRADSTKNLVGSASSAPAGGTTATRFTLAAAGSGVTLAANSQYLSFDASSHTFVMQAGTAGATLHLYRLIPNVDDPLYVTYAGASYLDADSTTMAAGEYVLAVNTGSTYRLLQTTSSGASNNTLPSVTGDVTGTWYTQGCVWTLQPKENGSDADTGELFTLTCTEWGNTVTMNLGGVTEWRYDAVSGCVFSGSSYLVYNENTKKFMVVSGTAASNANYNVTLYSVQTKYIYTGFGLADADEVSTSKHYILSTAQLGSTQVPYFAGVAADAEDDDVPDTLRIGAVGAEYTVTSDVNTVGAHTGTFTTTKDISRYVWTYKEYTGSTVNGDDCEFYNEANGTRLYLGISDTTGTRVLKLHTSEARSPFLGSEASTTFRMDENDYAYLEGDGYEYTDYGFMLQFPGNSFQFNFLHATDNGEGFAIYSINDNSGHPGNATQNMVYVYEYSGTSTTRILTLVSGQGDTLLEEMDYVMAAAFTDDNGKPLYYAVSRVTDYSGSVTVAATDVTNQMTMVINAGEDGYDEPIMIPVEAAWTQESATAQLRFYHMASSGNSSHNYLDATGASLAVTNVWVTNVNNTPTWYYDIINKRLSVTVGTVTYYMHADYAGGSVTFTLVTNKTQASVIHMMHVEATYAVERVDDYGTDDGTNTLESGQFVLAGETVSGWTLLGTDGGDVLSKSYPLPESLSEDAYLQMQDYIWVQKYYDTVSTPYATDVEQDSVVLQATVRSRSSSVAGVLVGGLNQTPTLQPYSGAFAWYTTLADSGDWQLTNMTTGGNTTFGTEEKEVGLSFVDGSSSNMTASQSVPVYADTITGDFNDDVRWGTTSSNVYAAIENTGAYNMFLDGVSRLLISEIDGEKYAIGCYGGTITYRSYTNGDSLDEHYKWTRNDKSGSSTNFDIINDATGEYAYVDSNGYFRVQATQPSSYFTITNASLLSYAYKRGADWYPYRYGTSIIASSQNTQYTARIYKCTYSGRNFTLTPIYDADGTLTGSNCVLVIKNSSGTRYIVGMTTSGSLTTASFTMKNASGQSGNNASDDDTLYFSSSNSQTSYWPRFLMTVSGSNGSYQLYYEYKRNSYTTYKRYLTYPTGTPSASSNFQYKMGTTPVSLKYDDTHGIYLEGVLETAPFGISEISLGFTTTEYNNDLTAGGTALFYELVDGSWTYAAHTPAVGSDYVLIIRKYVGDGGTNTNEYYAMGYSNGAMTGLALGTDLNSLDTLLGDGTNYLLRTIDSSVGVKLCFTSTLSDDMANAQYLVYFDSGYLGVQNSMPSYGWLYIPHDVPDRSRLWSVTMSSGSTSYYITVTPGTDDSTGTYNTVTEKDDAYVPLLYYAYLQQDGSYAVGDMVEKAVTGSGYYYVFAVKYDKVFYVLDRQSGAAVPMENGAAMPTTVTANYVWTAADAGSGAFTLQAVDSAAVLYINNAGVLAAASGNLACTWSYEASDSGATFGATTAKNASEVAIFKITKNKGFDEMTDVDTHLSGKASVTPTLNVTTGGYLLVAQTGEGDSAHYYSLAMSAPETAVTLDITDTYKDALAGNNITVFDASVWNQRGSDYSLIFDNAGYTGGAAHLMTANFDTSPAQPKIVSLSDLSGNMTDYTWNLHEQDDDTYLLGCKEGTQDVYLYFSASKNAFCLTANKATALSGTRVFMVQLNNEQTVTYQTFSIKMKDDGVTVDTSPLNIAAGTEIVTFGGEDVSTSQIIDTRIDGEYMVIAKSNKTYYALTYDTAGNLSFADVSLLFSGNASLMSRGGTNAYVLSVNVNYIWQQRGAVTTATDEGTGAQTAVGIQLRSVGYGTTLSLDGHTTGLTYQTGQALSGGQLYYDDNGTKTYLRFDTEDGFTVGDELSDVSIFLYAVGCSDNAAGGKTTSSGSYVYYASGQLPEQKETDADFSKFSHTITTISDLKQWVTTYSGGSTWETGWDLDINDKLSNADYSVYFTQGIEWSSAAALTNSMDSVNNVYYKQDSLGNRTSTLKQADYYAPCGAIAFAVPYASSSHPIYLNVIVSTEFDTSSGDADDLRWLAVWHMADVDADTGDVTLTIDEETVDATAENLAQKLYDERLKPFAAIPLPNHLGSVSSGADEVYLEEGTGAVHLSQLTDAENGVESGGWDHLIAHTFIINEPGVYYLGTTSGSVAYAYVSIYDMYLAEEDEDGDLAITDDYTIDFVWGEPAASTTYGDDSALGSICVVGETGDTAAETWRNSNIVPEFIAGDALPTETDLPADYDPVDELTITVSRTVPDSSDQAVSYVDVTVSGDDFPDVMIINSNSALERNRNKSRLHVPVQLPGEGTE